MGGFMGALRGGISGGSGITKKKKDEEEDRAGYKHGGRVRRTGMAKLHKGERVLTRKQAKKYGKR